MMISKKNYWLFSIVLLAAAESTYGTDNRKKDASPRKKGAGCLKKCKECCCKWCNKDDKNKQNLENDNNSKPEIPVPTSGV